MLRLQMRRAVARAHGFVCACEREFCLLFEAEAGNPSRPSQVCRKLQEALQGFPRNSCVMFFANLESDEGIEFPCLSLVFEIQRGILLTGQLSGTKGTLHEGYLEAALARPLNAYHYGGQCDLIVLASYLWHGIAEAHSFNDGNKRTATVVMAVFLEMNGVTFHESVPEHEIGQFVENLCHEGCFERDRLEHYLRTRCCWIDESAS